MYFDIDYYLRVVRAVWGARGWTGRRLMLLHLILIVPIAYVFNALCFLLDYVFFPSLWRQSVEKPVFIIGHARSGSTLLHRLMAGDAERFSYFRYWETKCPSLLQKVAVRYLAAIDRRFLDGYFYTKVQAWDEKTFAPFRHIHEMGLWHSEEDQFVMQNAFVTQKWSMNMPLMEHIDLFHVDQFDQLKRRRWMHHYKECIKRQLLFNGGDKIHLSKNPLLSGWVQSILDTFPDARIAVVMRNPLECIPSVLKLLEGNWRAKGWSKAQYQASLKIMSEISIETFLHPAKVLSFAHTPSMTVDYRRLTTTPADVIHELYRCFSFDISSDFEAFLQQQGARETQHTSSFKYTLADYSITTEAIEERLADFFETYGWPMSSKGQLRVAWQGMINSLNRARDAIDHIDLMPPPETDRHLAEGYKYLMGLAYTAIERAFHEDVRYPQFRNMLSPITRATIDNADAIYFYAPIDGRQSYRITAKVGQTQHWRGEAVTGDAIKAPHYLIFETNWGVLSGDTGKLSELTPGVKTQTGRLDSSDIVVSKNGEIEILLAPEKPAGYTGNFISTYKKVKHPHPFDPLVTEDRYANYITGRQLFADWDNEEAIYFDINPLDLDPLSSPSIDVAAASENLKRCGELACNQMLFWNAFWTIPMGTYGQRKGSLEGIAFPRNAFNKINAASGATGGGMSTNLYAGGVFDIADDEALIVEMTIPTKPQYFGFQLANLWGASIDYANHFGSLNASQMTQDPDGVYRLVIAHADPGVVNWLETTGLNQGFMAPRWAYSETPAEADWPTLSLTKVAFSEVLERLPSSTQCIDATQRREQILKRRRHVSRRFRHF